MSNLAVNNPEVVTEITALFEAYEQALIDKDIDILDNTFWNSPHTIRYACTKMVMALMIYTANGSIGRQDQA